MHCLRSGPRNQSIGRPPRWKRFRTRSSSSSPEKYDVSSHITLMMPNASARPRPRIHVKYHMTGSFSTRASSTPYSAEVLGREIEPVQLVVKRLLRQSQRFARCRRVPTVPPQYFLDQGPLELRHLIGQRPRRRLQNLEQLELLTEEPQHETVSNILQLAYVAW